MDSRERSKMLEMAMYFTEAISDQINYFYNYVGAAEVKSGILSILEESVVNRNEEITWEKVVDCVLQKDVSETIKDVLKRKGRGDNFMTKEAMFFTASKSDSEYDEIAAAKVMLMYLVYAINKYGKLISYSFVDFYETVSELSVGTRIPVLEKVLISADDMEGLLYS